MPTTLSIPGRMKTEMIDPTHNKTQKKIHRASWAVPTTLRELYGSRSSSIRKVSTPVPISCHIRATNFGKEWISMVINGVRFRPSQWKCHRFTRDDADLRSGFSFAGVAQW